MVILRTRNKITDFLMILAWASPFNTLKNVKKQDMTTADIISDPDNPFSDRSDQFIALETRNVMEETVMNPVRTESHGQEQYQ